jgi:glycosyltransferase involved in cell wall biosynthesis
MAVKNGGELMREAIDSILNQTFTDFEFIIINDGSSDNTLEILSEYQDPRIQVYSQENQGLARSLNRGVCLATGKYIARQDHDDISLLTRLEKQVAYLEENPQVGLLGTAAEIWNQAGPTGRHHNHPTTPSELAFDLIFNNPFVHTSWMFRSRVINEIGYYTIDPRREPPEDYEYVSRICYKFDVSNLPEELVVYRELPNSLSSEIRPNQEGRIKTFKEKLAIISAENIAYWNGVDAANQCAIDFGALLHGCEDKFSGKISFRRLKDLIKGSARAISRKYDSSLDKARIEQKVNSLRHQYLISKNVSRFEKLKLALSVEGLLHLLRLIKNRLFKRIYERITGPGPRREKYLKKITKIQRIK